MSAHAYVLLLVPCELVLPVPWSDCWRLSQLLHQVKLVRRVCEHPGGPDKRWMSTMKPMVIHIHVSDIRGIKSRTEKSSHCTSARTTGRWDRRSQFSTPIRIPMLTSGWRKSRIFSSARYLATSFWGRHCSFAFDQSSCQAGQSSPTQLWLCSAELWRSGESLRSPEDSHSAEWLSWADTTSTIVDPDTSRNTPSSVTLVPPYTHMYDAHSRIIDFDDPASGPFCWTTRLIRRPTYLM